MKNEELNIQASIINYLRMQGVYVFSVPNGTNIKNIATRTLMKKSGLLSGVADIIILTKDKPWFIEIKTAKGWQSDNQKAFEAKVNELGFEYYVWRSIDDAVDWYKEFNNGQSN